jgi:hypothetical protein
MTDVTTGADEATEDLTLDAPELEGEQEQEEQSGADTTAAPDEPAPKPKKSAKDRIDAFQGNPGASPGPRAATAASR